MAGAIGVTKVGAPDYRIAWPMAIVLTPRLRWPLAGIRTHARSLRH